METRISVKKKRVDPIQYLEIRNTGGRSRSSKYDLQIHLEQCSKDLL